MRKSGMRDDEALMLGAAAASGATGVLASMLASSVLNRRVSKTLSSMRGTPPSRLKLFWKNIPRDIQRRVKAIRVPGFRNAAFIPARPYPLIVTDEKGKTTFLESKKNYILYDPGFFIPGVVAHEYGHATDWLRNKCTLGGEASKDLLAGLLGSGVMLGGPFLLSAATRDLMPKSGLGRGLALAGVLGGGAVLGGLGSYLSQYPTLKSERTASDFAREVIAKSRLAAANAEANRRALKEAYRTYSVPPVLSGALLGLGAGLAGQVR